ncbi:MAG: hypothetical protein LBK63_08990 [Treponema sp.]|nr:hypothetical protein [Treponema sp.]
MKKAKFFRYAALALAAALTLAGCPTEPAPDPDPALIGDWTNNADGGLHPGLVKTFTIGEDFRFEASINPLFVGTYNEAYDAAIDGGKGVEAAKAAGLAALAKLTDKEQADNRWTVTGKLSGDRDNICIMSNMKETTGKMTPPAKEMPPMIANEALRFYNGHPVEINFINDNKTAFTFKSNKGDPNVNLFFGGNYTQKK